MEKEEKLSRKIQRLLRRLGYPRWLHHFGPKTYELYEHIFAFVVMAVCRLSLRRVHKFLLMIGYNVPTFSALCKSRKRISPTLFQRALALTAGEIHEEVAIDSTGISRTNPSYHYIKRIDRKKPIKSYVKQSTLFDVKQRTIVAIRVRSRPRHDIKDAEYLLKRADIQTALLGDTAYDAEKLHEFCWDRGIQTQIKPRKNVKRGFYRRKQMKNYSDEKYHQRSLIESGFGSLKRKYGGFTLAIDWRAIRNEAYVKAIAHNLRLSSTEIFN
jgi:transposase